MARLPALVDDVTQYSARDPQPDGEVGLLVAPRLDRHFQIA